MNAAERMRLLRERRRAAGFKAVITWVPQANRPTTIASSHRLIESRSLAMHALIVRKIERNPELLEVAHRNIARWATRYAEPAPAWLDEWREILLRPWPEIAFLLTEQSENAARLRQSTPFAGVLTPRERRRIHEALRA
ncbi:MAG: hypothetical protein ACREVI_13515 [Steroidobacteraceae bacterium]